jgi:hypothetical protein
MRANVYRPEQGFEE